MKQIAVVVKKNGERAVVETSRKTACDNCERKSCDGGCEITGLIGSNKKMTAAAIDDIGAEVGDTVEIESKSSTVIGYAAVVFIFPIVAAMIFYGLGMLISQSLTVHFVSSLIGFIASFAVIYFTLEKHAKKNPSIHIVGIIHKNSENS